MKQQPSFFIPLPQTHFHSGLKTENLVCELVIARLLQRLKLMFFKKILNSEGPFGTAPFEIIF